MENLDFSFRDIFNVESINEAIVYALGWLVNDSLEDDDDVLTQIDPFSWRTWISRSLDFRSISNILLLKHIVC